MSLLYRAVWTDALSTTPSAESLGGLRRLAAAWAQETADPEPLTEGVREIDASQGRRRRIEYRPIGETAFGLTVTDQGAKEATVWTTVIRAVVDDEGIHTLVENEMESDDPTLRVSVGRPKVVHELLAAATKPKLGASALLTAPQAIPAEGIGILTEMLATPGRTVPWIVCSEPGGNHDSSWLAWANRIASRTEGVAVVITLDHLAVTALKNALGDLAVWGGGIRVYGPKPVTPYSDGWRHRYYSRSRLEEANQTTIDTIVYSVAQLSGRRRVPDVFRLFTDQGGLPIVTLDGMVPAEELAQARDHWEFELELSLDERSELSKELARANGHLARLKQALIDNNQSDIVWGTQHEDASSIPDEVQDTSEAVLAAQTYLSEWLSVPHTAPRELEDIDTAPTSYAWGNNTWRGLRALAAYAEDRAHGWNRGASGSGAPADRYSAGQRRRRSCR